jgi:putative ABC transport system permease protein
VGLVFALAPAVTAARVRMPALLRAGGGSETKQSKRLRGLLVAGEIALALVLAVGAGLMLQSLWRMQRVDPGFNPDRVLTLHVQPANVGSRQGMPTVLFYRNLFERLQSVPGVASAGAIQHLPFSGYSWNGALDIEGHPTPEGASRPTAGLRIVTPDYFRTMAQPVIAGREFVYADAVRGDAVIVNETLAKMYYGGAAAALNRRIRIRGGGVQSPWMAVVGVVGDVRHTSLTEPVRPAIYTSISDKSISAMMVAVRASGDPLSLVPAMRDVIWSIDRNTPISNLETMSAKIGASLARPRLLVILLGSFAAMGVLLALVGVYGVVAYSVAQRRREIGIMVALGAGRSRVMRHVLADGLRYAAAGLAVGVPAALAGSRLLGTLLYGVDAGDARTYVSLAGLMLGVVLAASYVPARRASRVDPIEALKYD